MFWVQTILTGIAVGSIFSLAAMGVVVTYKATGVFNFAHGALGVLVAYLYYQLSQWGVPVGGAGLIAIGLIAPVLGLALERFVFRPLARAGATTTEKLVATLGVFVAVLGIVFVVWTGETRAAPNLFSPRGFDLGSELRLGIDQLAIMVLVALASVALWALFNRTHLGTEIRAVVDRPHLAELAGIDTGRVAGVAWALGAFFAGLAGVLLVGNLGSLEPVSLTLLIVEAFSLVVVARLTSVPVAVGAGILILGVGSALFEQVEISGGTGLLGSTIERLKPNLSVVLLFGALLAYRSLDVVGEAAERRDTSVARSPLAGRIVGLVTGAIFVLMPYGLGEADFDTAHRFLAFSVIFVSIVVVTGFSGQITLGQAAFAGLGAWASARIANAWDVPVVLSMLLGGLVAVVAGLVAGFPALRRRGLFLALTTLAIGLLVYRIVLENPELAGGVNGLQVVRPSVLGWSLDGPVAFYYFELVVLGLCYLLARNVRRGRLGRALGAMRDSEAGARSVGIELRSYKLFVFGTSAFVAGLGGALLTQQAQVFDATGQFFPLESLFWFAVVVVAGVESIFGAVLAAAVWVVLDQVTGTEGLSQMVIGVGALTLGRLAGRSALGVLAATRNRFAAAGRLALADAVGDRPSAGNESGPAAPALRPSPLARELLAARAAGDEGSHR